MISNSERSSAVNGMNNGVLLLVNSNNNVMEMKWHRIVGTIASDSNYAKELQRIDSLANELSAFLKKSSELSTGTIAS